MAAKYGYIGNNPDNTPVRIARRTYTLSGVQTTFTFDAGYNIGYVDVYLNGVRQIENDDFIASDGSTVGFTSAPISGDIVEIVAYKAFDVIRDRNVVEGDFRVIGDARISGILTVGSSSVTIDGVNNIVRVGSGVTITSGGINASSGIITASNIKVGTGVTITSGAISGNNSLSISGITTIGVTTAYVANINDGPISGMRNRIINGGMRIDQRNAGATFTASAGVVTYGVDRWYLYQTGSSVTGQRVSTGRTDFSSALQVTGASGNTYAEVAQRIESLNSGDLVGQSVTVSFLAARSTAASIDVALVYPGASDNWSSSTQIATQSVSLTSSLARYTVTFSSLPSQVSNGLLLLFGNPSGLGAGVTFTITGVQLEAGTVATPFERRSYGLELALCQRYFEVLGANSGVAAQPYTIASSPNAAAAYFDIYYKVEKRANPTLTDSNPTVVTSSPSGNQIGFFFNGYKTATGGFGYVTTAGKVNVSRGLSGLSASTAGTIDLGAGAVFYASSEL